MSDRLSHGEEDPDPHAEERTAFQNLPAQKRVAERMRVLYEEFLLGIADARNFSALDTEIFYLKEMYDDGQIEHADFVIDVLKQLNTYAVPLTRSLMEELGIGEFSLRNQDFDTVCLDFISAQSAERMLIDPDSIPEEMDELPMTPDEIGDRIIGTLECTEDGRWYCKGEGEHGWFFSIADEDRQHPDFTMENRGKPLEGNVRWGKLCGCKILG
jgi:hypothetical protein